jgi:hypothetical protein
VKLYLILPYIALLCLSLGSRILSYLALPYVALPCLALPCLALPRLAFLPFLTLPCLAFHCITFTRLALSSLAWYMPNAQHQNDEIEKPLMIMESTLEAN